MRPKIHNMVVGNLHFITITRTSSSSTSGFANGHYVMEKNSIFSYKLAYDGEFVDVDKQKNDKWDSKRFNIEWPCTNPLISKRDANGNDS